ncbi:MAG: FAD-dependent oxidoreductase [Actinomycetota bacterium]
MAGEHTAGDWAGLMEGALRSGIRAADEVHAAV